MLSNTQGTMSKIHVIEQLYKRIYDSVFMTRMLGCLDFVLYSRRACIMHGCF